MPRHPWTSGLLGFDHLRLAPHTQHDGEESDCVVYSLWMVANYIGNEYPNRSVRENTNIPNIDDVKRYITTDELGWRPNQGDLTDLSAFVSSVQFSLESWPGSAPRTLIDLAAERLDNDLPLIAFIDAKQLREGQPRGSGPLHSIVIVGINDEDSSDDVAIADPWFAAIHSVSEAKLEDAWDPSHHQIIDVAVNQSTDAPPDTDQ